MAIEARHALGLDETGTILWVTDMGWVMGSFLIAAAFANGATAVFFDGTPDWPDPDRLWACCQRAGVSVLGVSPTLIRSLMRYGPSWPDSHDFEALCAIGSTGEPWNGEPWRWCFRHIGKQRVPIVNLSGGTECGGGLVSGSTVLPCKPTSFNGPALGMATDVVDDEGRPVRGAVGELVVRAPWPGMTKGIWQDGQRYLETYWLRFPGLWQQGDFAYIDSEGYWYLLGRSDDTIKLAGKRVGPAEIESALVQDDDVVEAAAIGIPDDIAGEALLAFVVLRAGTDAEDVCDRLTREVRTVLGPALVPKQILSVDELPKTRSGKILRRVLKSVYLDLPLGDLSSLDSVTVLDSLPTHAGRRPTG
jgi:acetyl-CoA synthetase